VLNLKKLVRNYKETAALNEQCSLFAFIDTACFLTKTGDVGVALAVNGIDYECLDRKDVDGITKRLEAAFKLFGPEFTVYQYLFKSNYEPETPQSYKNEVVNSSVRARAEYFTEKADDLFSVQIYYVILFHSKATKKKGNAFSTSKQVLLIEREIDVARGILMRSVNGFVSQLSDFVSIRLLPKNDAFKMFRRLMNVDPVVRENDHLKYDVLLDKYLVSTPIECYRDHLDLGGYHTRVLILREEPAESWPLILQQLFQINATYHITTTWRAAENDEAKKHIEAMRLHFHNTKTSLVSQASSSGGKDTLKDDTKTAFVGDLGECLLEIGKKGNYFGKFSLTVVVYARELEKVEKAVSNFRKVFSRNSGELYSETYNQLGAFFATQPGNQHFNLRQLWVTNNNYADWAFLFSLEEGERWNSHLNREALAIVETADSSPYYLNLHQQIRDGNGARTDDVAHTFITGRTGSGKSFFLNFLTTALQKYDPYTFIFDLGGSYKKLTELFGGAYLKISSESNGFSINPFVLEPTKENIEFLYSFVKVLIEGKGDYALTNDDDRNLYQAIDTIYSLDQDIRRLRTLSGTLPKHLAERLQKWIEGGQYGTIFDNERDTLTLARFQCFDFEGMEKYPQVIEPLLFYVLHRASFVINDPDINSTLKVFELDEAWRFFTIPAVLQYLTEAAKTWRKKNGVLIMATQSVDELRRSDLINLIVESFPTKIFLANPDMDYDLYAKTFHLNQKEIELISTLIPKREMLLKTSMTAKKFALNVDPKSYWIYTNSPRDNERFNDAVKKYGLEKGLEYLADRSN